MLISRVPEDGAGQGEPARDIARNCQTASELFDLMTKDRDFEAGDDPLSTSDLVLLYKNIDLGTQLMSNVRTNQYVETVYHDDPETDSDLSESCSSEELRNIMLANKDRIDLLNNQPSFNSLSHKLGDLEIQVSNLSTDLYDDRHFLHKDPYIKEQLQSLQLMTKANDFDTNLLPTSLLDYICGKRLDDNSNFYMDNVITYVTHTIEQLKRISNGDYLPDKVKEKWRESDKRIEDSSKVLSTCNSMPLQRKTRLMPSWDDIVRTEVDLRSLVKLLEKKVVIEVPRMICGSYKFFSKFRADKLVISCKRNQPEAGARAAPRVDVVLRVQSAAAAQLASHTDSMLTQLEHQISQKDSKEVLPLEYQNIEEATLSSRIIEISDLDEKSGDKSSLKSDECSSLCSVSDDRDCDYLGVVSSSVVHRPGSPEAVARMLSTAARVVRTEAASNHATPNDLHVSMVNLDRQARVLEENTLESFYVKAKKKSPERPRVKSPYENKSYILEERKRRKLLEVRERRERRKKAANENSKVSKHKAYPQAVSSVTKLSITNKAFYNSIYGRNGNGENANRLSATALNRGRKGTDKVDGVIQENGLESEGDAEERRDALPDKTIKKICTNFLDDTETEMSFLQSKQDSDFLRVSTSTSVVSNESATNLLPQLDNCSSLTSFNVRGQVSSTGLMGTLRSGYVDVSRPVHDVETIKAQDVILKNPANSPNGDCDKAPAIECRRSLEKIYTLMKKLHQIETTETSKKKGSVNDPRGIGSENSTNLKRRVSFSNPRFEIHPDEIQKERDEDLQAVAVPKVVISAKHTPKNEDKKERKTRIPRVKTIPENPLIAISQLLHEFDNVQKSRPKIADPQSINRSMSTENTEQSVKPKRRRSRVESPVIERPPKMTAKVKTRYGREERPDVKPPVLDKKITELMDEVKEARGEAVRGPPRFSSRLHALAQPKRAYVQALAEDFPKRQVICLMDEVKEVRGEAVRGPPRFSSRLHALAQPKRAYVQALAEDFPKRQVICLMDEVKEARGEAVRGPPRFSSRLHALAQPKRAYVQALAEDFPKRQVICLMDEVKEARGEAVRGPPRFSSRLHALAQPKRAYVQALAEDFPKRQVICLMDEVKEARGEAVRGPPRFSSRLHALAQPKRAYVQALAEDFPKRQVICLMDEVKEARGEAVRGPPRFSSRLHALAQPKRAYVQALAEDFPKRQVICLMDEVKEARGEAVRGPPRFSSRLHALAQPKRAYVQALAEDFPKRQVICLMDEVKEARGEAVRGPPRFSSRLHALAQPKRAYVQALAEDFPKRQVICLMDEVKEARGEAVRGPPRFSSRLHALAQPKRAYVQALAEDFPKRQVICLMDEVKEARGEAVRGPPRFSSRLHALAQPKRAYVQALAEDFPKRQVICLMDEVKEARGEAVRGPPRFSSRLHALAQPKRAYVQALAEDFPKRQVICLMDEVKEARGEAVRGPPRFSSRLHALAQPKRAYVQALAEDFPKRQSTERPSRPASHTPRARRRPTEGAVSPAPVRAPNSSLERAAKPRHAAGSPEPGHRVPPNFASLAEAAASTLHTLKESPAAPAPPSPHRPATARAPLLPEDIQLTSHDSSPADDDVPHSSFIGIKLHHMVRAMLSQRPASDTSREPSPSAHDSLETPTVSSTDVLVEQTVLEEVSPEELSDGKQCDEQFEEATASQINSVTEIEILEHALHRTLSSGAFAGRLRVNKLTLSPRPSLQQVMMQQSGDTTLVLKSSLHQKIHVNCQSSDQTTDLMGLLSTTRLNCGLSGFPLQISTVGFAFPTFQCELKEITPQIVRTDRLRAADAGTSYEVSEPAPASAVRHTEGGKTEEACQCVASEPGPAGKDTITKAHKKNAETAPNQETTVFVLPSITWNRDEEITPPADQENDLPSDYTASFDILVGLLNEIQKITTCGCDATSAETVSEPRDFSPRENVKEQASYEDEDGHANCVSLYMSKSNDSSDDIEIFASETKSDSAEATKCKPVCEDKEVLARVEQQQATASTSRQAILSPNDTATTSTCTINVPTTTCSVSALAENCEIGCNTSIEPDDKMKELAAMAANRATVKSLVPYYNNMIKFKVETKKETVSENPASSATLRNATASSNVSNVPKIQRDPKGCEEVVIQNSKKEVKDLDSTLKVKRDILVTFYSILVLTVFAALAFPEMLQFA